MTPKERVIAAIRHQETDYLPYTIDFCGDAYEKMIEHHNGKSLLNGVEQHIVRACAWGFPREKKISEYIYQDGFGTQWDKSMDKGVGVIVAPLFTEDTFDSFEFPDPTDQNLYTHFPSFIEENADKFKIAPVYLSYFERSWAVYGFENVLMDMASNEGFMFKMLDKILEYNLKLIDQYLRFDIDCIHINDDYGQQKGLIMGPKFWRKYFKPGLKVMYDRIKSAEKYVYHHSCGDLTEIIPDFIELGVDILNPFQPEAMDVFKLKEEYGKYITFHGGVSEQKTMALGTPDVVERETRDKITRLGKNGGYILGPSQEITRDVPFENVERFIQIITSQNLSR